MFKNMYKSLLSTLAVAVISTSIGSTALFAEENTAAAAEPAIVAPAENSASPAVESERVQKMKEEVEVLKLQAEIEKARAEVEKAKAEAEKSKTEAEVAKGECEKPVKEENETGFHKHDGFFLRMTPGLGVGGFKVSGKITDSSGNVIVNPSDKGAVAAFSLLLGGEVAENLTIHADFWSYSTMGDHDQDRYTGITTGGVGLGLTYYFMPHNLYLSGTVSPAFTAVSVINDSDLETEHKVHVAYGINASLTFGKEWWVSKNWGLGIAVRGEYGHTEGDNFEVDNGAGLLLFSASFQ